ncbi:unnamed protein product [Lactuca saligna]|uniref:Uncharacterized protein n=1 Tax=Lactuca saligna TaxID=75948 RepID=A0AA36DWY5_LACSI|nr:unnamed protein product [Lactuca saligna]
MTTAAAFLRLGLRLIKLDYFFLNGSSFYQIKTDIIGDLKLLIMDLEIGSRQNHIRSPLEFIAVSKEREEAMIYYPLEKKFYFVDDDALSLAPPSPPQFDKVKVEPNSMEDVKSKVDAIPTSDS